MWCESNYLWLTAWLTQKFTNGSGSVMRKTWLNPPCFCRHISLFKLVVAQSNCIHTLSPKKSDMSFISWGSRGIWLPTVRKLSQQHNYKREPSYLHPLPNKYFCGKSLYRQADLLNYLAWNQCLEYCFTLGKQPAKLLALTTMVVCTSSTVKIIWIKFLLDTLPSIWLEKTEGFFIPTIKHNYSSI